MSLRELWTEILERYPQEYERDSKASNPYFKDLKARIQQTLQPITEEFDLTLKVLGGQGLMRKMPYISFLAEGHRTSKGINPGYFFNIDQQSIYLKIGDADDNGPPAELVRKFAARSRELLPDFRDTEHDGYPCKVYAKAELDEDVLMQDLQAVCEVYQTCIDEFAEEIQIYLQGNKTTSPNQPKTIWVIQAGTGGDLWNEWYKSSYISIGWSALGNPTSLNSLDNVRQALIKAYPGEISATSPHLTQIQNAHSINNFVRVMQIGDLVAAVKGRHTLLGIGRVTGEHTYHPDTLNADTDRMVNRRTVTWLKIGEAYLERGLPIKTLTPFYPDYINYRKILEYWQGQEEAITYDIQGQNEIMTIQEKYSEKITPAQILFLIDKFLEWYEQSGEQRRENDPELLSSRINISHRYRMKS